jgi:hypothetical protein
LAEITPVAKGIPLVDERAEPTRPFRNWLTLVERLAPVAATGSPEGVLSAPLHRFFWDDDAETLYFKAETDIDGDDSKGWVAIGGVRGYGGWLTDRNIDYGSFAPSTVFVLQYFQILNEASETLNVTYNSSDFLAVGKRNGALQLHAKGVWHFSVNFSYDYTSTLNQFKVKCDVVQHKYRAADPPLAEIDETTIIYTQDLWVDDYADGLTMSMQFHHFVDDDNIEGADSGATFHYYTQITNESSQTLNDFAGSHGQYGMYVHKVS